MSSVCFAGLLYLLLTIAPNQVEGSKPATGVPAPTTFEARSIRASTMT